MAAFGLKPGPQIGQLIDGLREAQAAGEVTTENEALAWLTEHVRPEQ
jgi:predicted transcriptional regulator